MLVTRTSTGVFPRAIRGNGLRGRQSHLDTLRFFLRPYFIRINYPTISIKKQVKLIVYEYIGSNFVFNEYLINIKHLTGS